MKDEECPLIKSDTIEMQRDVSDGWRCYVNDKDEQLGDADCIRSSSINATADVFLFFCYVGRYMQRK